ncbi:MAG: hypothetical protein ACOX2O_04860 [Bdellovibrionota bacterium]|jgi:hypothetical protein
MSANKSGASGGNTPSYNPGEIETGMIHFFPKERDRMLDILFGEKAYLNDLRGKKADKNGYSVYASVRCPLREEMDLYEGAMVFWKREKSRLTEISIYIIREGDDGNTLQNVIDGRIGDDITVIVKDPEVGEKLLEEFCN